MNRFAVIYLIASWVIYFATDRGVVGSIFLILSGIYALVQINVGKKDAGVKPD